MQWKIVSYIQVFSNVSFNKQDTRKNFYDTKLRVKPSSHRIKTCLRTNSCLFKRICIEWQCWNEIIYQLSVARAIWKTNNIEDRQLFMANNLFQCIYYKKPYYTSLRNPSFIIFGWSKFYYWTLVSIRW